MGLKRAMLLLALALLVGVASPLAVRAQSSFFGLSIGMSSHDALVKLRKPVDALEHLKPHDGQRILTDTCPLTFCKIPVRRSIGFDSVDRVKAIGLTYKTSPDGIKEARDCAFSWLSNTYGPPSTEEKVGDMTREVWHLGKAKLTLEAKNYNPNDYFVLIYYYQDYANTPPQ